MPLFKAGTFVRPITPNTGEQAITGVGFQPKAIMLFSLLSTAAGGGNSWLHQSGMAVSALGQASVFSRSDNGGTTAVTAYYQDNTAVYADSTNAGVLSGRGEFVSFDADGFTIDWTDVTASAVRINYVAIGGSDIQAAIKEIEAPTSTGAVAYTGVGFQPDALFVMGVVSGTTPPVGVAENAHHVFGVAASPTQEFSHSACAEDGVADSDTYYAYRADLYNAISVDGAQIGQANLTSFDADGFTLNWTDAAVTEDYIWVLCLKGGQYAVRSFDQRASTGSQAYTGVGFRPKGLMVLSSNVTAIGTGANARLSAGAASGATSEWGTWIGDLDAQGTIISDRYQDEANLLVSATEGTPTLTAVADLTTFDADGFTLEYTTADATVRKWTYFAIGDALSGGGSGKGGGKGGGGGPGGGGGGGGGGPGGGGGGGPGSKKDAMVAGRRKLRLYAGVL